MKKNILNYFLIGSVCGLIDYLIFLLCFYIGFHAYFSNFMSSLIGLTIAFFLNLKFNYYLNDNIINRLVKFYFVGIVGTLLSSFLIFLFIEYLLFRPELAKLLTFPAIFLIQFSLNNFITFTKN